MKLSTGMSRIISERERSHVAREGMKKSASVLIRQAGRKPKQ